MLDHLLLGVALGAGSSALPGACALAVTAAACRQGRGRAIATAAGAALGDALYAALGILGVGRVLARHPALPVALQLVSGVVLIAYGARTLRRPPVAAPPRSTASRGGAWRGVGVGLATLLASPAALVTWVLLVGGALATAPLAARCAVVVGIALGTAAWLGGLGLLVAHRGATRRGDQVVRITRVVCRLLISYGVVTLARVVAHV